MPSYDYRCEANGRVVEVRHGMNEAVASWGELCRRTGIDPGDTPADSPVQQLITGGYVITGSSDRKEASACDTGSCCGGGFCGLN
jgi:hypothetical protein